MKTYVHFEKETDFEKKTDFEKSQGFLNSGSIMDCQLLHHFFRQIFLIFLGNVNINISNENINRNFISKIVHIIKFILAF